MMFFNKDNIKCKSCNSKTNKNFSFCPYCGYSLISKQQEIKDFGLLGKHDSAQDQRMPFETTNFGISDKLIGSIMNTMIKSLNKQIKDMEKENSEEYNDTSIEQLPNGIKISIGMPKQKQQKKQKQEKFKKITEEQISRMSGLPRVEAKTKIRRYSNKVIYEISASDIESPDDVLISRLESGYEIKAIGKRKIFVNTLPINLPIRSFSFDNKTLFVEFSTN